MLRNLPKSSPESRVDEWVERLSQASGTQCAVKDLYSGDHWSIARDLDGTKMGSRRTVRVWVVSAGYGLLGLDHRIHPYAATFAIQHPDSVVTVRRGIVPVQSQRQWWKRLTEWPGAWGRQPRTIAGLAAECPRAPLIVVASEIYLQALRDDLWAARQQLADPQYLAIISAGSRDLDGMRDHLVPCDARLESLVGGARQSLNIRVAKYVLGEIRGTLPTLPVLRERFTELLANAPEMRSYDRKPLRDEQVQAFIRKSVNREPQLRPTPLLRRLRDKGFACEYTRFLALFRSIEE